jgi:hypothetical protein
MIPTDRDTMTLLATASLLVLQKSHSALSTHPFIKSRALVLRQYNAQNNYYQKLSSYVFWCNSIRLLQVFITVYSHHRDYSRHHPHAPSIPPVQQNQHQIIPRLHAQQKQQNITKHAVDEISTPIRDCTNCKNTLTASLG